MQWKNNIINWDTLKRIQKQKNITNIEFCFRNSSKGLHLIFFFSFSGLLGAQAHDKGRQKMLLSKHNHSSWLNFLKRNTYHIICDDKSNQKKKTFILRLSFLFFTNPLIQSFSYLGSSYLLKQAFFQIHHNQDSWMMLLTSLPKVKQKHLPRMEVMDINVKPIVFRLIIIW